MKKLDLAYFRTLLIHWREQLMQHADLTITGLTDSANSQPDLLDRASLESDRDLALHIQDRERKLIRKINAALNRIEEGEYGICEICGEEIDLRRLRVRPVTTCCIDCKRAQETMERLTGT
jgi:DnaK suppressor protein